MQYTVFHIYWILVKRNQRESVHFILISLPLCPCLQPLFTCTGPCILMKLSSNSHSPPIYQIHSYLPTHPTHLTPTSTCSSVTHSPITLSVYIIPAPFSTQSPDCQCCFSSVQLLSSLLNLNLCLNLLPSLFLFICGFLVYSFWTCCLCYKPLYHHFTVKICLHFGPFPCCLVHTPWQSCLHRKIQLEIREKILHVCKIVDEPTVYSQLSWAVAIRMLVSSECFFDFVT